MNTIRMIFFRSRLIFKAIINYFCSALASLSKVGLVHSYSYSFFSKFNNLFSQRINLSYIFTFIFLILILINLVLIMYETYSHFYNYDYLLHVLPNGVPNDKVPMDPVRYWPSGVPQSAAIVGTALTVFGILNKMPGVSPRLRVLGGLAASGVSATTITYHSAIENPLGFNRFMWGLTEYRKTGVWPSLDKVADKDVNDFAVNAVKNVDQSTVDAIVKEVTDKGSNSFSSSDISDYVQILFDYVFKEIMQILKPVQVQGFFDDLIGQRLFIELILFIMCLFVIILFIIFIMNIIFILNIDKIKIKFSNKFILFYFKYQTYLSWITLIYVPIFIFIGLLTIFHGLHWLIVNQIPYDSLEIDLHTFISSKSIGLGLAFNKIKFFNYRNFNRNKYIILVNPQCNSYKFIDKFKGQIRRILKIIQSLIPFKNQQEQVNQSNKFYVKNHKYSLYVSQSLSFRGVVRRNYSSFSTINRVNNNKSISIIDENKKITNKVNNLTTISSNLNKGYQISSPIFKELISILTNNPINQETQLRIEQFLKNQALELIKLKLSTKDSPNSEISNSLILKLIEKKLSLVKLIVNYKANLNLMDSELLNLNTKIIMNMDTKFLINIMYGRILSIISNNQLLNNKTYQLEVTIDLGKEMVNKYLFECYNKVKQYNPNITFIKWKQDNQELITQIDETQFKFDLGNILINFLVDLQLIKTEVKILAKNDKKNILIAGPALVKYLSKVKTSSSVSNLVLPNKIPMIVPGKLYKFNDKNYLELGGYLLNGEEYTDEIILSNWELSSKTRLLERNDICDMVNKINSVAFKINENVLDFILLNNDKYGFFINDYYIHPLSLKPKLSLVEQRELKSFNSRKHLEQNILGLATIFIEVPCFYLPVRLDYRGRLYCVTEYLNYQGIELAKGLLQFSIGEKVKLDDENAINYLKIFGANSFGHKLEKQPFKDRIAWIDNNLDDIINFDNGVLLNKAENKIFFLSFCFEFKKYIQALNNKDSFFVTNLPIQLDASCNGFQHLTLLIDDLVLSKELNLSQSSWEDKPGDFYNFIALKIKKFFKQRIAESQAGINKLSPEDEESYEKLARLEIFRTLIKKAVMTIPYNASAITIKDYIKENFDKLINPKFGEISNKDMRVNEDYYIYKLKSDLTNPVIFKELDFNNLRKALKHVIFVDYPNLTALAEYLKGIAKVSNNLNIPIPWILPTGLEINQQYYFKETLKVKPFVYTKNLLNLTVLNKKQFNNNKQKIALMPNLVHSLDAASLCLVIVNYFKQIENINFYSIHDCFAVPCNKVTNLIELLKTAYCIIYSESKYLLDFDSNFRTSIINSFGKDAVSFNEAEGQLIINLKTETIIEKYPSISSVISNTDNHSLINLKDSNYLIH